MKTTAMHPHAALILQRRNVAAALGECVTRLEFAKRTTDHRLTSATVADALFWTRRAQRAALDDLHALDPAEALALAARPAPPAVDPDLDDLMGPAGVAEADRGTPLPGMGPGSPALDLEIMGPTYTAQQAARDLADLMRPDQATADSHENG